MSLSLSQRKLKPGVWRTPTPRALPESAPRKSTHFWLVRNSLQHCADIASTLWQILNFSNVFRAAYNRVFLLEPNTVRSANFVNMYSIKF